MASEQYDLWIIEEKLIVEYYDICYLECSFLASLCSKNQVQDLTVFTLFRFNETCCKYETSEKTTNTTSLTEISYMK